MVTNPVGVFTKDPNATLNYAIDWISWLDDEDSLVSSTWLVDEGLTVVSDTFQATGLATVFLSGGTSGQQYFATNRVTTSAGLTDDRTILIRVKQL